MITFRMAKFGKKAPSIISSMFICPYCLEDCEAMFTECPSCGGDVYDARSVIMHGVKGRETYRRLHWSKLDRVETERLEEKRNPEFGAQDGD